MENIEIFSSKPIPGTQAATQERIDRLGIVAVAKGVLVAIYGLTTGVLVVFISGLKCRRF